MTLQTMLVGCSILSSNPTSQYNFDQALTQWALLDHPETIAADDRFSQLAPQRAKLADRLDENGVFLGTYSGDDMTEHGIIAYLLENDVIDANIHIEATVYLMSEGTDEHGYWAVLVSEDPYWTNEANLEIYSFAVRFTSEGSLWMHNASNFE